MFSGPTFASVVLVLLLLVGFVSRKDDPDQYHHDATHLVDEVHDDLALFSKEKRLWINETLSKISKLSRKLNSEAQVPALCQFCAQSLPLDTAEFD